MNQLRSSRTRSSEEIRRDIELNRSHLGTSIDALLERLSPGEVLDQLTQVLRGSPGVKMKRSSRVVVDTVRENPLPLALIGAGIAWLAIESGRDHEEEWDEEDIDRRLRVAAESGRHRAETVHEGVQRERVGARETLGELASTAAEKKDELTSRASEAGERLRARGRRGRDRAQRAASGLWDLLESNPLAAGAAVFGVGLVAGLSVPASELEDRLMGEAADTIKDEARAITREVGRDADRQDERQGELDLGDPAEQRDLPGGLPETRGDPDPHAKF